MSFFFVLAYLKHIKTGLRNLVFWSDLYFEKGGSGHTFRFKIPLNFLKTIFISQG